VLPEIFGINLYATTTIAGYVIGVGIGLWLGLKDGRDLRDLLELGVVIVLSAVLGAKVFHTLFESAGHHLPDGSTATGLWDLLRADPWHWARLFESGYVFYGGVVGALGMGYLFTVRAGLPRKGAFGDYAAPGLAIGIFVGRLGCFLAGCCYGAETDVAWAITFPAGHTTGGAHVHPVQLYDAAFGLVAFAACVWYYPRRRFAGELFGGLVASYAVWRFVTEMFRADGDRGVWFGGLVFEGGVSTSQIVSLAVLPVTAFFWLREARRAKEVAS
jgi:phosphatidylglycerol:prolipoprotein diacylglycerol transferase